MTQTVMVSHKNNIAKATKVRNLTTLFILHTVFLTLPVRSKSRDPEICNTVANGLQVKSLILIWHKVSVQK